MRDSNQTFISIILPVYNEAVIIGSSVKVIVDYLKEREEKYRWEILIVNDGSSDDSGEIAENLSEEYSNIRVLHNRVNMNLGATLQRGFKHACGEIIVVLDVDLSYSEEHIDMLVNKQIETDADVVLASPYMKGGKVTAVPYRRALLSRVVNRFMRFSAQQKFHTFTGMVRAYKADFIKNLNLKTTNYEINPEILYKAMILRARIVEIPAHLDWSYQNSFGESRSSGMRFLNSILSGFMAAFIFSPYKFFFSIGAILLILALYILVWIAINTFQIIPSIHVEDGFIDERFSQALGIAYRNRPHAFFVGGISLILSLQILSMGFLSLQKKRYYEELFHLNSSILKIERDRDKTDCE